MKYDLEDLQIPRLLESICDISGVIDVDLSVSWDILEVEIILELLDASFREKVTVKLLQAILSGGFYLTKFTPRTRLSTKEGAREELHLSVQKTNSLLN